MEIKHTDNGTQGSFYIEVDGQKEAEMTYVYKDESTIDIDHTEVKASLQGQGIGSQLIEAAVAFMKKKHLKVVPSCSYAKAVFEKKRKEYQDVIK
jgi:predicted GNAT family acetyltransferase